MLEHQLATQLLERYAQLNGNNKLSLITSPHSLLASTQGTNLLNQSLLSGDSGLFTSSTAGLLTTSSSFLNTSSGLLSPTSSPSILNSPTPGLFNGTTLVNTINNQVAAPQSLLLPRYNTQLSGTPTSSQQAVTRLTLKTEEGNSRRLRWKEEHGRALISIWKEKYPQVRSAKKIKEKHAIWQEIGDEYNKLCARFDWPARSTEQVKIKVKNCIDEYKQTIKYNQEYKTCPYFKEIDDIFGMSDPDKSADLQQQYNQGKSLNGSTTNMQSDNCYWMGSSLPTQVKKRKLNISKSPDITSNVVIKDTTTSASTVSNTCNTVTMTTSTPPNSKSLSDMYLLNLASTQTEKAGENSKVSNTKRYDLRLDSGYRLSSPQADQSITLTQFSDIMKQLHERELKLIETYHKIDAERLNAYIERERERHEAEALMEESKQRFINNVIDKLLHVIKDNNLTTQLDLQLSQCDVVTTSMAMAKLEAANVSPTSISATTTTTSSAVSGPTSSIPLVNADAS